MTASPLDTHLADFVTENFRTAAVFEKYGLDFCCGGKRPLGEVCREKGIDSAEVLEALARSTGAGVAKESRFKEMDLDVLIDYILEKHHSYVRNALPVISAHAQRVVEAHGEQHGETIQIAAQFAAIKSELESHMIKEEAILFPYIKALMHARRAGEPFPPNRFGTIRNPIGMMEAEHENAGKGFFRIRDLSVNYTPPEDACTTFRVLYQELDEFERDLHQHIHLENNILFPKSVALENELAR